jgi:hypothetical protein
MHVRVGGDTTTMRFLRSALTLVAVMVPPAASVNVALANSLCGTNSVYCYPAGTITSTDAAKSCSELYCSASYDLIGGTFAVAYVPGGIGTVTAVDQYRVEGVSPGIPLVFSAELDVSLRAFPYDCGQVGNPPTSSASASLREGDSNQSSASITTPVICYPRVCCPQAISKDQPLRVTVTRSAGELFSLHVDFSTSGSGSGQGYGQLRFAALPPGAYVVSCQGYRQDFPTAAKRTSWGRLKTVYR